MVPISTGDGDEWLFVCPWWSLKYPHLKKTKVVLFQRENHFLSVVGVKIGESYLTIPVACFTVTVTEKRGAIYGTM